MTPSNRSGALPEDDGVDVVHRHLGVVERPEDGLAHQSAEGHVEPAGLVVGLTDPDDGTRRRAHDRPSRMQMRFCCRHGPAGGVGQGPGATAEDVVGGVADAAQTGGHDRIGPQRASRGVDGDVVTEAEHRAQEQLLVGEGGLQLGHLDRAVAESGRLGRDAGSTASRPGPGTTGCGTRCDGRTR